MDADKEAKGKGTRNSWYCLWLLSSSQHTDTFMSWQRKCF